MKIRKAIQFLELGKPIRRAEWPEDNYIKLDGVDIIEIWNNKEYEWHPTTADLLADDWEVVE